MLHLRHNGESHRSLSVECNTTNFGIYQLLSIPSVCKTLFHECASIRSRFRIIQRTDTHMLHLRHNGEDCRSLSVECTPPTLMSISSSPSPVSVKLCCLRVHWSVHDLKFYRIISRLMPICYTWGIMGRAVDLCQSNAYLQFWCLPAPYHPLCLLNFVPWVSMDPFTI